MGKKNLKTNNMYINGSFIAFIPSPNIKILDVATRTHYYVSSRCLHKRFIDDEFHND
jgi:hypothetical protein